MKRTRQRKFTAVFGFAAVLAAVSTASAAQTAVEANFRKDIHPLLSKYCFDCHADGMTKGNFAFDEPKTDADLLAKKDLWLAVLKNVRAGLMPPEKEAKPTADEIHKLEQFIKRGVFNLDPDNPDPGRVTLRRLNRHEYRNTIKDLMGIDFRTDEEFPPDDTGYGFDNIGDVLTVSPLLLEKYMQAAETIVATAVPTVSAVVPEQTLPGSEFRGAQFRQTGDRISFYTAANVTNTLRITKSGTYRITANLTINGAFDFDPGRANIAFQFAGKELWKETHKWEEGRKLAPSFEMKLEPGQIPVGFTLEPLVPVEQKKTSVDLRIGSVKVEGPLEKEHWTRPPNFERFFTKDAPSDPAARRQYAKEILAKFVTKAYRKPADAKTVDRLLAVAEDAYSKPGKKFEEGISRAMVAALASPRFLFRLEGQTSADPKAPFSELDEFALASRLSYFFWSTMPDEELFRLAERGELRKNLAQQVRRLSKDSRSRELVENFVGQWLQVRDVTGIAINERAVLARDRGQDKEQEKLRARFRELRANLAPGAPEPAELVELRKKFIQRSAVELDGALRKAMTQETQMLFEHVFREDRSVLELLDSDYTFLNERLAKHYGVPDVTGDHMRLVTLPADSPRGGILTHGSVLTVTSNPTRTSPVKRGIFILDNILGTPAPPPPPNVPELEEAEKEFKGREPSLRETLELHRSKAICRSCHNRMDPLGLALENFNALGMWREKERSQPIDAKAQLVTGEKFDDIRGLKKILATERRGDFYRCLTEKFLTYALGRGLDYHDVQTVDDIVARLERENGKFSALLNGIVESPAFLKRRNASFAANDTVNPAGLWADATSNRKP